MKGWVSIASDFSTWSSYGVFSPQGFSWLISLQNALFLSVLHSHFPTTTSKIILCYWQDGSMVSSPSDSQDSHLVWEMICLMRSLLLSSDFLKLSGNQKPTFSLVESESNEPSHYYFPPYFVGFDIFQSNKHFSAK